MHRGVDTVDVDVLDVDAVSLRCKEALLGTDAPPILLGPGLPVLSRAECVLASGDAREHTPCAAGDVA